VLYCMVSQTRDDEEKLSAVTTHSMRQRYATNERK
jgi:hypothetical protein